MTSVLAGHIILTPTQPVETDRQTDAKKETERRTGGQILRQRMTDS